MKRMGFEGKLYYGTPGAEGATELTIARKVNYTIEPDLADISDRGSLVNLSDVAGLTIGLEFEINNQDTDPAVAALRTAILTGAALALRTKDKASGWGLNADFVMGTKEDQDLRDAQRITITASPTDKAGRAPAWS